MSNRDKDLQWLRNLEKRFYEDKEGYDQHRGRYKYKKPVGKLVISQWRRIKAVVRKHSLSASMSNWGQWDICVKISVPVEELYPGASTDAEHLCIVHQACMPQEAFNLADWRAGPDKQVLHGFWREMGGLCGLPNTLKARQPFRY